MSCEEYKGLFAGWLDNNLPGAEREKLELHILECKACAEELADMEKIWAIMGGFPEPEPSARMDIRFDAMLTGFEGSVHEGRGFFNRAAGGLSKLWQWQPRWPLAYTLLFVLASFGSGYWFFGNGNGTQQHELTELSAQVHGLKQTMMLALLENPMASERIKGVSYTSEIKNADNEVTGALLATLNSDPNVNVRLSTLEALTHLAGHPEVREGLVKAIEHQDSPLVQYAIADIMLKLQETRAVKPFKELLKQKKLNDGVRSKIEQTINSLI